MRATSHGNLILAARLVATGNTVVTVQKNVLIQRTGTRTVLVTEQYSTRTRTSTVAAADTSTSTVAGLAEGSHQGSHVLAWRTIRTCTSR